MAKFAGFPAQLGVHRAAYVAFSSKRRRMAGGGPRFAALGLGCGKGACMILVEHGPKGQAALFAGALGTVIARDAADVAQAL
eukprot:gene18773-25606_t